MCTLSMEHFNAPRNINEYHYIWSSDLREFGLKGFGLARVYCIEIVMKCCLCGRCQLQISNIINSISNAHGLLQESLAFKEVLNDCMASWKVLILSGGGSISAMLLSCSSLVIFLVICIIPEMRRKLSSHLSLSNSMQTGILSSPFTSSSSVQLS